MDKRLIQIKNDSLISRFVGWRQVDHLVLDLLDWRNSQSVDVLDGLESLDEMGFMKLGLLGVFFLVWVLLDSFLVLI